MATGDLSVTVQLDAEQLLAITKRIALLDEALADVCQAMSLLLERQAILEGETQAHPLGPISQYLTRVKDLLTSGD